MFSTVPVEYRTLFLGDLSLHCNEQIIHEIFGRFGTIEQIRMKNASMNQGLSYSFVTYVYREDAEAALRQLNGTMLLGRKIRIGWATPKNANNKLLKQKVNPDNLATAQIHFSFIAKNANIFVTEETIRGLFSSFGEVLDVALKKSEIDRRQNVQSGYGFLHYPMSLEGITAAINATNYVQKICVNQVRYDCCLTRSLQRFVDEHEELRQMFHGRRAPTNPPANQLPISYEKSNFSSYTSPTIKVPSYDEFDFSAESLTWRESDSDSSHSEFFRNSSPSREVPLESRLGNEWMAPRIEFSTYGSPPSEFTHFPAKDYSLFSQTW